jgi:hypothetical protein
MATRVCVAMMLAVAGTPIAAEETPVPSAAQPATFYVSPRGSDGWSGTRPDPAGDDGPLPTLALAVEKARKVEAGQARRIVVADGTYFVEQPLILGPQDSGLLVEAAPGAKPLLVGGRRIAGWQKDGEKFWAAKLPDAARRPGSGQASGPWDFRLLVVSGRFCPRARLPKTGTFNHLTNFDVPWMSTTGGGWKRKPTDEELTTMRYDPKDLEPWLDVKNAELTVYHMWDESVVGLKSMDTAAHALVFSTPAGHPPGAFGVKKYVVWNVREGMTEPGQWCLDRTAGKVVYWPREGEDMTKAEALAPVVESILRLEGTKDAPVRGVTVRGLSFTVTGTPLRAGGFGAGHFDGAVSVRAAEGCRLEDLEVFNAGGQGVKVSGKGLAVVRCEVHDTGACGIMAHGDDLVIEDNLVHDIGLTYPSAIGLVGGGKRGRIRHNEVHDTPYSAVNWGGEDVVIEANLLYRAMKVLHDGAGIYTFGSKRLVMRGNFIRDIVDTGGYGASAYYLDEQCEGCTVEGNLALRVARPSHNHMARDNTIRGNVFVCDADATVTFPRCSGFTFEKNVIVATGKITFQGIGAVTTLKDNVLFSRTGKVEGEKLKDYSGAGREEIKAGEAGVMADPQLLDGYEKGLCRFAPDSPALKLGIQPIDVSGAGRQVARKNAR